MLGVIITLLLVGLLIWGIIKKMNAAFLLIVLSFLTFAGLEIAQGTSVLGENSTGSFFIDLFENIVGVAGSTLGRNVLLVMTVMGYVTVCEKVNATKMFAVFASKPLKKIKSPYMIAVFVIILGIFLKLAITSSSSLCTMLIATMYPIMRAAGVSRGTAATAVTLPGCVIWGPSDANIYLAFTAAGVENVSIADFFVHYQIPMVAVLIVVFAVTVPIFSKMWDKKEGVVNEAYEGGSMDTLSAESLGVPKFYAIFPILPLIFILIFSTLIPATPVFSVGGAHWLCLMIVILIDIFVKRSLIESFNNVVTFFQGMGRYLAIGGMIMVGAALFSTALRNVGGMAYIGQLLTSGNTGYVVTLGLAVILGFVIAAFSHVAPALNIFVPLFVAVSALTGGSIQLMILALLTGASMGIAILPTNTAIVIASGTTEISIPGIMKRNALPAASAAIAVIIVSVVMYAVGY